MYWGLVIVVLLVVSQSIEIAFTLHKLKKFKLQNFGLGDNTSNVVIGTYLYHKQSIDALKKIETAETVGIRLKNSFRGKTKYYKVFGEEQDYDTLLKTQPQIVSTDINNNRIIRQDEYARVIIEWKSEKLFDSDEFVQLEAIAWLQRFIVGVPSAILKIPAHFLCRLVGGIPLHEHLHHSDYIIEMHGENNQYQTFQSIFSDLDYPSESDGYTNRCPQNPSTNKLKLILDSNKTTFNIQKTLNPHRLGYFGLMKREIADAQKDDLFNGIVFFDDHPINIFDI